MSTLSHDFEPPRFPVRVPESEIKEQNLRLRYILQLTLNELEQHRKLVHQYASGASGGSSSSSGDSEVYRGLGDTEIDHTEDPTVLSASPARRSQRIHNAQNQKRRN
ncbi:hypothetical protein HGRIS_014817 [Hohenbuehelia grisea]|uniref:Uncharacterized protein n=1 Tax=Hohenbuehelia grisea TaxID=104357 RepID=A0ABR3IQU1_9AGAR